MLTILVQKQEMIQLRNKQQEEIKGLSNDHQMNLVDTNKRQMYGSNDESPIKEVHGIIIG